MPGVLDVTGRLRVGLIVIGVLFFALPLDDHRPRRPRGRAGLLWPRLRPRLAPGDQPRRAGDARDQVQCPDPRAQGVGGRAHVRGARRDARRVAPVSAEAVRRRAHLQDGGAPLREVVVDPQLRSAMRDVTAEYEAKFLYSSSRELVAQNMFKHIQRRSPRAASRPSRYCCGPSTCPRCSPPPSRRSFRPSSRRSVCASCSTASVRKPSASGWKPRASRTSRASWPRASARSSSSGRQSRWPTSFPRARTRRSSCSGTRAACPSS